MPVRRPSSILATAAALAFDPGPPPPGAAGSAAPEVESASVPFQFTSNGVFPVYSTRKRWRALDVFLDVPSDVLVTAWPLDSQPTLGVLVYAVSGSVRTLVRSGRYALDDVRNGAKRVVALRGVLADRLDVVLVVDPMTGTVEPGSTIRVQVMASDEDAGEDSGVGVVQLTRAAVNFDPDGEGLMLAVSSNQTANRLQLVDLAAVSGTPGLFLHVHDAIVTGAALNGGSPLFACAIPHAAAGVSAPALCELPGALRARWFSLGLAVVVSSTPFVTTAAGANQAAFQAWYR